MFFKENQYHFDVHFFTISFYNQIESFIFQNVLYLFQKQYYKRGTDSNMIELKDRSIYSIFQILLFIFYFWLEFMVLKPHQSALYKGYYSGIDTVFHSNAYTYCVVFHCVSESIDQGRAYENQNINVSYCFFIRSLLFGGNGGVIMISIKSLQMNISNTMFYNCTCSERGGAIYFYSSSLHLRMFCANRCSASIDHFSLCLSTGYNQVEFLSVSSCSHTANGWYPFCLVNGNQGVDNTNSSMNNAYHVSGICIWTPSSFECSHCTFSNNKVSGYICISLSSNPGTMSSANIIHNDSPSHGVIYVEGSKTPKMTYCIFQNNQNTLFYVNSGSVEVSHSFIDHSSSFLFSDNIIVSTSNNNSFTKTITYQIHFFNSFHCNADDPFVTQKPMKTIYQTNFRSVSFLYQMIIPIVV